MSVSEILTQLDSLRSMLVGSDRMPLVSSPGMSRPVHCPPLRDLVETWRQLKLDCGVSEKQANSKASRLLRVIRAARIERFEQWQPELIQSTIAHIGRSRAGWYENTLSERSLEVYVMSCREFQAWVCTRHGLPQPGAINYIKVDNASPHPRRSLRPDELNRLIAAAEIAGPKLRLAGPLRAAFYLLLARTGFRRCEAATLTPESFDLSAATVTVQKRARGKTKKRRTIPLHPSLVERMRPILATIEPGQRIWPFTAKSKTHEMIKHDCLLAGVDYSNDEGFADIHSLRHTFATTLIEQGATPREWMHLMGHSNASTALEIYAHSSPARLAEIIGRTG